jgi:hypothetical protein
MRSKPHTAALQRLADEDLMTRVDDQDPDAFEVYEVWVQRNGRMEPSSLFVPRHDRSAEAAVRGPLEGADAVLVTREPLGGSPEPTSQPLLRAELQ